MVKIGHVISVYHYLCPTISKLSYPKIYAWINVDVLYYIGVDVNYVGKVVNTYIVMIYDI